MGSAQQDDRLCRRFAASWASPWRRWTTGWHPKHPYPAPLEDCYSALTWLAGLPAVDPGRVAIGGASAGGGLAAALALLARDRGEVAPAFQLLVYPMLDDRSPRPAENSETTGCGTRAAIGSAGRHISATPTRSRRPGAARRPGRAAAGVDRRGHPRPVSRRRPRLRRTADATPACRARSKSCPAPSTASTSWRRKLECRRGFSTASATVLRVRRVDAAGALSRSSLAKYDELAADDGGRHHAGVQLGQHHRGRLGQHTEVPRLSRSRRSAAGPADPAQPKNIVKASRAETHSSALSTAPLAVVRCTAARIAAHGSPSPNGMSVDSATGTAAFAATRPATAGRARRRGRRRGTDRRARRRSWAASPP